MPRTLPGCAGRHRRELRHLIGVPGPDERNQPIQASGRYLHQQQELPVAFDRQDGYFDYFVERMSSYEAAHQQALELFG